MKKCDKQLDKHRYPRNQKCNSATRLFPKRSRCIRTALFLFKNPSTNAMLNFGGTPKHMWIWSGIRCPSINSTLLCGHKSFSPRNGRTFPGPPIEAYDNEMQVIKFITHYYLNKYSISFYLILYHYSLNMGDFIMIEEPIYYC